MAADRQHPAARIRSALRVGPRRRCARHSGARSQPRRRGDAWRAQENRRGQRTEDNAAARRWLGDCLAGTAGIARVFPWHGETFEDWCASWPDEAPKIVPRLPPCVQTPQQMQRLPAMRRLAEQLYTVWINGLKRD